MFRPCWPNAGPTGGLGLACPALTCSLTTAANFFAMTKYNKSLVFLCNSQDNVEIEMAKNDGTTRCDGNGEIKGCPTCPSRKFLSIGPSKNEK